MNEKTSELPPEAKMALQGLTEKQRKAIRKNYPFRPERNKVIRQLRQRGVPWHVIAEVSGLSRSRVMQIGSGEDRVKNSMPGVTSEALKEFKRAFEGLYKATLRLFNGEETKGGVKG